MVRIIIICLGLHFSGLLIGQNVSTFITNVKIDDALIFDDEGNLYGANYSGSEIFKITKEGVVTSYAGGFNTPNGMAFDSRGNLFICDNVGNKIYKISTDRLVTVMIPNFYNPSGILKMMDSDTMIITSYLGNKIVKMSPDGKLIDFITSGISGPVGMTYGENDQLFVAEFGISNASGTRRIFKIENNGYKEVFSQLPGGAIGFITYSKGNLYATSFYSHKIYTVDDKGKALVWLGSSAGNVNGDPAKAKFNNPNGIIASIGQDSIFVSEFGNRSIRLITNFNSTTAIQKLEETIDISIFPNPVANELRISYPSKKGDTIHIYNQNGQIIEVIDIAETSNHFSLTRDFSNYAKGIYFINLLRRGESILVKKILKQNE